MADQVGKTMNIVIVAIQRLYPLLTTRKPIISLTNTSKTRIIALLKLKKTNTIINVMRSTILKRKTDLRGKNNIIKQKKILHILNKRRNTIIVTEMRTNKQENGRLLPEGRLLRFNKGIFLSIKMNSQDLTTNY